MSQTLTTPTEQPLSVPAELYNENGIAVLTAHGTRYGGMWPITLMTGPADSPTIHGQVVVETTDDPEEALNAVKYWAIGECARLGLRVAHIESRNDQFAPAEKPYFVLAQVLIVGKEWE